jgi:hypothetical protein
MALVNTLEPARAGAADTIEAARPVRPRFAPRLKLVWAGLAVAALLYLVLLAFAPDLFAPTPSDAESNHGQRTLTRAMADVKELRGVVGDLKRDLSTLTMSVAAQETRGKVIGERVAAVEGRVAQFAATTVVAKAPAEPAPAPVVTTAAPPASATAAPTASSVAASIQGAEPPKAEPVAQTPAASGTPATPKVIASVLGGPKTAEPKVDARAEARAKREARTVPSIVTAANPGIVTSAPATLSAVTSASGVTSEVLPPVTAAREIQTGSVASGSAPPNIPSFGPATVTPAKKPSAIQLASGPSPDSLRLSWSLLMERHANVLRTLEPRITGSEITGYNLVAGPFNDAAAATRACGTLRQRGVTCLPAAAFAGDAL